MGQAPFVRQTKATEFGRAITGKRTALSGDTPHPEPPIPSLPLKVSGVGYGKKTAILLPIIVPKRQSLKNKKKLFSIHWWSTLKVWGSPVHPCSENVLKYLSCSAGYRLGWLQWSRPRDSVRRASWGAQSATSQHHISALALLSGVKCRSKARWGIDGRVKLERSGIALHRDTDNAKIYDTKHGITYFHLIF